MVTHRETGKPAAASEAKPLRCQSDALNEGDRRPGAIARIVNLSSFAVLVLVLVFVERRQRAGNADKPSDGSVRKVAPVGWGYFRDLVASLALGR